MQTSESIKPDRVKQPVLAERALAPLGGWQAHDWGVTLTLGQRKLALQAISNDILRLVLCDDSGHIPASTVAVLPDAVQPRADRCAVEETDAEVTLRLESWTVRIDRQLGKFDVTDSRGSLAAAGMQLFSPATGGVGAVLQAAPATRFYGLGEEAGGLDKRHEAYTMWNSDVYAPHVPEMETLYVSIPYVIRFDAGVASGLFLDNPGKTKFDFRSRFPAYEVSTATGGFDCYLFAGPTLKDVISAYTRLTGRMQLPPRWAMGYHQSRYSYETQDEVLALAHTFQDKEIPLDAIYLDIHYMDGYRVFTFDRNRFPNPQQMCDELRDMGINVVTIVDPGVKRDPEYHVYRDGIANDVFCKSVEGDIFIGDVWPGPSAFPDFTDDRVARWWADLHDFYLQRGVRGIWNDMNEPAVFNETKTMDIGVMHRKNGHPRTHRELHNLYGMLMSKATYEGLAKKLGGERPFLLTRAGYSGVQRYAAVWTGDNRSFWEHMAMAIPMVLNMGMSGIAFGGPDVGGFAHHTTGELLARWTQMGAFFPFFRNHSALETLRQEPWSFGEDIEHIVRKYIRLRYRLLPYQYTLFREASETGVPIMRPLVLEYPDDPATYNLDDQFLVGCDILVAPVCRPDLRCRAVYLPAGTWVNYWTGEHLDGGRHVLVDAPLATLPLFVRAGSIIPVDLGESNRPGQLALEIYEGKAGEVGVGRLYEDDGLTFAYREGRYRDRKLTAEFYPDHVLVRAKATHDGYGQADEECLIRMHWRDGTVSEAIGRGSSFEVSLNRLA
ncbi:alpha-glucosidase [Alicyclobacillus tengchongensis]|nr:alpha-glucosidase [Alicyclobacillus tengchongensis]